MCVGILGGAPERNLETNGSAAITCGIHRQVPSQFFRPPLHASQSEPAAGIRRVEAVAVISYCKFQPTALDCEVNFNVVATRMTRNVVQALFVDQEDLPPDFRSQFNILHLVRCTKRQNDRSAGKEVICEPSHSMR